jgi:predicted ATP-binding protein involved in virulence
MADNNLLRVTGIRVNGLFGRYSHEVALHLEERVTIIHGPNGVGKTVILRLTAALLAGKLMEFGKVPFDSFEVSLSDNSTLGAKKKPSSKQDKFQLEVVFYLRKSNGDVIEYSIEGEDADINLFAKRIEAESPYLSRVGPDQYLDRRTDELMTAYEVAANYEEFVPGRPRSRGLFDIPDWMLNLQERVGVHFIEAQRLLRFAPERNRDLPRYPGVGRAQFVETVKDYAKDLEQRISGTLATYAKVSQSLDQSFPERLLKSNQWEGLSPETLKNKMQELEVKRQNLREIGLIEQDAADPFDVSALEKTSPAQQSVMTLYVEDTEKKLGVLDELARRISLMLENINRKFTHKSIRISRAKGFTAVTPEGKVLELGALSSGEQHELVLLYDLLFRVKSNTLVLIDEPELSLHVTWQKTFLPDLLEIVSATKFDVLLATHSPFIVGDRNDLMVPLEADSQIKL